MRNSSASRVKSGSELPTLCMRGSYNGCRRGWHKEGGGQTLSVYDVGTRISSMAIYLYVVKERHPHLRPLLTKPLHALGIPIHQVWHGVHLKSACCTMWQNDLLAVIATEIEPSSYPLRLCCARTSPKTAHCMSFVSCKLHLKPA